MPPPQWLVLVVLFGLSVGFEVSDEPLTKPCEKRELTDGTMEKWLRGENEKSCKQLNVDFKALSDNDVDLILSALAMPTFMFLRLRSNSITTEQSDAIMQALGKEDLSLGSFIYRENPLSRPGANALAFAIADRQIRHVDLRGTQLDDESMATLAEGLARSKETRALLLNGCGIGPTGMSALAAALKTSAVENLEIRGNPIGDAGAKALATAIMDGAQLRYVVVSDNSIGDEGKDALRAAAAATEQVEMFDVAREAIRKNWKDEL